MAKVIFVVLDGLNYQSASVNMGFLQAMCEENLGRLYCLKCEIPSLSRPLYECLLTGVKPILSGVVNNSFCVSKEISLFDLAKKAGLKAGAAAYHWVYELYNKEKFIPHLHRHINDENLPLPYGHFYYEDDYLDSHLFADAENLRINKNLDFLLVHSMNIDDAGHKYGSSSEQYANKTKKADNLISLYLPTWLKEGYNVIITSDHGMNKYKNHGGLSNEEREVPFFVFGDAFSLISANLVTDGIRQTEICGSICEILGIPHQKTFNQAILKESRV